MRTGSRILTAACLVVFIGISMHSPFARAQDAEDGIPPARAPWFPRKMDQSDTKAVYPRSPGLALGLSLGSTVLFSAIGGGMLAAHSQDAQIAGAVILSTGFVFGPSVGEFYSERWGKGLLFALGRAAAEGMVVGGLATVLSGLCFDNCDNHSDNSGGGIALMVIGGVAGTVLMVWGIVDSYNSAKQYNEEYDKKSISLSPFVIPSSGRNGESGTAYGLAVAGRF